METRNVNRSISADNFDWHTDRRRATSKPGRHMGLIAVISMTMLFVHGGIAAMKTIDFTELPVIDLEEFEVIYNRTDFSPSFSFKSPNFTYYDVPELPKGELIMALDFIDRYRQSTVPGQHKWAGLLTFPMIDSQERRLIKWLCLYMYDDVMYGYDPTPRDEAASRIMTTTILGPMVVQNDPNLQLEWNRRFVVPVRYEERTDKSVLYRFAESYVESVSPEAEDYFNTTEFFDESGYVEEFAILTQESRIAPIVSSQKGKEPEDLVRLVYQFYQEPNPGRMTDPTMGPDDDFMRITWDFGLDLSGENIKKELGGFKVHDYIDLAKNLVAPRWSQKVTFHYNKNFLFWELYNKSSILLFNIGNKLYAYSPRYGVWKTDAIAAHLNDPELLKTKLKYPGIEHVESIELIPN